MSYAFENEYLQCSIETRGDDNKEIHLKGYIKQMASASEVVISASKPINRMTNYTGSGLPYPCAQVAFENTPNLLVVRDPTGAFDVVFSYPNSYYTADFYTRIEPSVFVSFQWKDASRESTMVRLPLEDRLPLRTLTYRPGFYKGPQYYAAKTDIIGVRGAEATMRSLASVKAAYDVA
jgi:hypothetical protein